MNNQENICVKENCEKEIYNVTNSLCRSHYRQITGEHYEYWQKVKSDPERLKRAYARAKKSREKMMNDPIRHEKYKKKHNEQQVEYYHNNPKRREYIKNWKKNLPIEKKREYARKDGATRHFGSWKLRESIVVRDGEKCTKCNISRQEHKERWKQDLHVDHIDNYGRGLKQEHKNNDPENLITLCIRCHRSKSAKEKRDLKREKLLEYSKEFTEELKEKVRDLHNRKCDKCYKHESEQSRKLDVHHIDGDKWNNDIKNLTSLCIACHSKVGNDARHRVCQPDKV